MLLNLCSYTRRSICRLSFVRHKITCASTYLPHLFSSHRKAGSSCRSTTVLNKHIQQLVSNKNKAYFSISTVNHSQISQPSFITADKMSENQGQEVFSRLPKTVVPIHYKLKLKPNLNTFEGEETVDVRVESETNEICLNAVDLKVSNISWISNDGKTQLPEGFQLNETDEVLKIQFNPALSAGNGSLKISFTGELNDKLKGFYRSKYKGPNGEERFNAVTQFEATDARRAFPCWDEPALKSTFDVTLVTPKDRVALSNMPIKSTTPYEQDESLQVLQYETTPIMSTYLLAFIVGEFDYLEGYSKDGIQCRVYTPVGKKEQGKFALDVCVRVLPYYKDYFGIAYPLPKMDLVAIADFSSGAMENWGLVTYRETALLVDEKETSATSRQWVAIVVGHELAHQWFGNLVTMEWWTHLWLNEGYATFVEFMCVEHLFPEYDIWTQFVTDTHNRALELDCLKNSHPIEVPVNHPREIDEIFDDISYSKGGSVIRMLHHFIGDDDFKKGMNIYLTRHKYKNTFTEDLWKALEEASSKPVGEIMTTWTKQMGFPLIIVEKCYQEGNNKVLTLRQEKFWADPKLKSTFDEYNWMVPLTFSTRASPKKIAHKVLMKEETLTVTIENVGPSEWVKVNPGTVGFYRVHYQGDVLGQLMNAVSNKEIPPLDRLGLIDDMFALVQTGQATTANVMCLLPAYVQEDNYTVWTSVSSILGKLNLLMAYSDFQPEFKAYGRRIFSQIEKTVGWEARADEGHLQAMLRTLVLNRMISFDNEETRNEAKARFALHVSGKQHINPDLRSAVYKGVLSDADQATLDTMLKIYRDADNQEEQDRISRALGAIKDPALIKQVLDFSISDKVRKQDTVFVLISVGMSKDGRELAWNFFKENWKHFKDSYPCQHIARVIKYVIENFVTEEKALEVEAFFQEHEFPGTERTVHQSVEQIRLNKAWIERDFEQVGRHLKANAFQPTHFEQQV